MPQKASVSAAHAHGSSVLAGLAFAGFPFAAQIGQQPARNDFGAIRSVLSELDFVLEVDDDTTGHHAVRTRVFHAVHFDTQGMRGFVFC